jgi:hypothetical protein
MSIMSNKTQLSSVKAEVYTSGSIQDENVCIGCKNLNNFTFDLTLSPGPVPCP